MLPRRIGLNSRRRLSRTFLWVALVALPCPVLAASSDNDAEDKGRVFRLDREALTEADDNLIIPSSWFVSSTGPNQEETVVILPDCIGAADRASVLSLRSILGAENDPSDRTDGLEYAHEVRRIEPMLKARHPELFDRLIRTALTVDARLWRATDSCSVVHPEIELITYDAPEEEGLSSSAKPGIAPHIDNDSILTTVFLLTDPEDFTGGDLTFEGGLAAEDSSGSEPSRGVRVVELGVGDCAVFRGEKLEHWVTPILSGRRIVLHIELEGDGSSNSRDDGDDDDDDDEVDFDDDDYYAYYDDDDDALSPTTARSKTLKEKQQEEF